MNTVFASIISIFVSLQLSVAQETEFVDIFIAMVYEGKVDDHTCKRVMSFAPDKMTINECLSKAEAVNPECEILARQHVKSVVDENERRKMVEILMVCPVAKLLEYPYIFIDGDIKVEFP